MAVLKGALIGGFLATVCPSAAWAALEDEGETETPAPQTVSIVEITVVGSEEELATLREATAVHDFPGAEARWLRAERFEKTSVLARAGSDEAVVLRAWIALSPGRAELYFADRAGERFLVREVPLPNGLDALGRESVSEVLTLSTAALLDDARAGLTRAETSRLIAPELPEPRPVVEPETSIDAPPPAPPTPDSLAVAGFYTARAFGEDVTFTHGPGVRIAWVVDAGVFDTAYGLSAAHEFSTSYSTEVAGVEWSTALLRARIDALHGLAGSALRVGWGLGAGADVASFTPRTGVNPALELTPSRQVTLFVGSVAAGLHLPLGRRVTADLELELHVYPKRLAFAVESFDSQTIVLSPWALRPALVLGFTVR